MNRNAAAVAGFVMAVTIIGAWALPGTAHAQAPNKYGWVYGAFPTGFGWVAPRVSPTASITQDIGVTEVHIRYARPGVRDREIWGGLVPYDTVWRAGANESTYIRFSTDVRIEGQMLKAGDYSLFAIPRQGSWEFIFSHNPHQWGHYQYDPAEDALHVTVKQQTAEFLERLQYAFPTVTDSTATLELRWERLRVPLRISVDTAANAATAAESIFDWTAGFWLAQYLYEEGSRLEDALRWTDASIGLSANPSNLSLRARILADLGRYSEAVETLERALPLTTREAQRDGVERLIQEWRNKTDVPPSGGA